MIHVIPGFLSDKCDFAFLNNEFEVVFHDLRHTNTMVISAAISPSDTVVGYSLGGRASLQIADESGFAFKKLILLASHPGLHDQEQIQARKGWEDEVLTKLTTLSSSEFYGWWNQLNVFQHDSPLTSRDLSGWAETFAKYRLSDQTHYLSFMKAHRDKILYVFGDKDEKYSAIATNLSEAGIRTRKMNAGHRLFQSPNELMQILREEIQ